MLQAEYFEEIGQDDWFSNYSKAYQNYTEMLFELTLSKKEEKEISVNGVIFPVLKQQIEESQKRLIGEVIGL